MKRSGIDLQAVTEWANLCEAFYLAARGKRNHPEVRGFARDLDVNLAGLGRDIRSHSYQPAPMTCFRIRDPKPRIIHAPCFRDRVAHHAIMLRVGPMLERALVFDTYACRKGKGTLAAVQRCHILLVVIPGLSRLTLTLFSRPLITPS